MVAEMFLAPSLQDVADSYSQSIGSIPKNITYIYCDHDLEPTRGTRFQVNAIDSQIRVVDIAPSKAPKMLGDWQVKCTFIRRCTHLDLSGVCFLMQRCVSGILLILLERGFSQSQGMEDLATHWSLRSDRPCMHWMIHSFSDVGWVGTANVLVCIWDN